MSELLPLKVGGRDAGLLSDLWHTIILTLVAYLYLLG
jgi:hypothetical protein